MFTAKPIVLICDDSSDVLEYLKETMEHNGFTVHTALNATELMKLTDQYHPQLIICDVVMPDRDGFWAVDRIKIRNNSVPVIMMSAYHDTKFIRKSKKRDASFLAKPFDDSVLINLAKKLIMCPINI